MCDRFQTISGFFLRMLVTALLLIALPAGFDRPALIQAAAGDTSLSIDSTASSIAITSDGKTAYVTDNSGAASKVRVIDIATNTIAQVISNDMFSSLTAVLLTPDNASLYLSGSGGDLVMKTSDFTVSKLPTSGGFSNFVLMPDSSKLFIASGNIISLLDPAANTLLGTITLPDGSWISSMAVHPAGTYLYGADNTNHRVYVIEITSGSGKVLGALPVGNRPEGLAVTQDGSRLLVANFNSDTVTVVNTSRVAIEKTIPVGDGPCEVHISPDGKLAFITHVLEDHDASAKDTVWVIAVERMMVVDKFATRVGLNIPGPTERGVMAFLPASSRIYLLETAGPVYVPSYVVSFDYSIAPSITDVYLPCVKNGTGCSLLFTDDFSTPAGGWYTGIDSSRQFGYYEGEYRIVILQPQWGGMSIWPGFKPENFTVSVDVRNSDGTYGSYGIIFGQSGGEFYTLEIYPDGGYGIYRYLTAANVTILKEDVSPALKTGLLTNNIKIERIGPSIKAYANNQLLASVTDSLYTGPRSIGLVVFSYDDPMHVDIRFDNFSVASCGQ